MLNEVLHIMEEYNILQNLNKEDRCSFIKEITNLATADYDCNSGEILDVIGKHYKICSECFKETELKKDGICPECDSEVDDEDEDYEDDEDDGYF